MMDISIGFYRDDGTIICTRIWSYVPRVGDGVMLDNIGECVVKKILWHMLPRDGRATVDVMVAA